ncbi:helix-turn-helix domain-containing protein [Marinomonas epiphytica]
MNQDIALNLRLLCSYYKSISEVCERLGISRSQFNRYLNGRHRPAANTLRKICEFFNVAEHELQLPHAHFRLLVQGTPPRESSPANQVAQHLAHLDNKSSEELEKYVGFYYEYYYSMSSPGKILKSLVNFTKQGHQILYQRTERLTDKSGNERYHCKYLGIAHYLSDRIFMMDYESLTMNEITQTILYPEFKNRIRMLHGLRMGVSSDDDRMPCSSRVVMEYLGEKVSVKQALSSCQLYDPSTSEIHPSIIELVNNKGNNEHWQFRAKN